MEVIRVAPGQEVMDTVERKLEELGISDGAIVSVVGAIDRCTISNMPVNDAKDNILSDYERPFEMSGTGEVAGGKPHIHCVLGTVDDRTLSGHLHRADVENWFVNVYVLPR